MATSDIDLVTADRPPKDPRSVPVKPRPYRLPVGHIVDDMPIDEVAAVMAVSKRTVQRWRHTGVDGWTGDRFAVKVCGVTGYDLWGDDFNLAFEKIDARAPKELMTA